MFFEFEPDIFNIFILNKTPGVFTEKTEKTEKKVCGMCGWSFANIGKTGKTGCGKCYSTFKSELTPAVAHIHGTARHTGKIPKNMSARITAKRKTEELNAKMQKAVAEQNFEEAAAIRDEINKLKTEGGADL
jgi:protein arginine kinase activator